MKKTFTWPVVASFLIICLIISYFIYLAPYMTDNYIFSHEIKPGYASFYSGESVNVSTLTLASAFRQAKEMYFTWCGRYAGNLVVYLLFLLPHWCYTIVAALLFGFYILLLLMLVFGRAWRENLTPGWLFTLAALVWAGVPSFGEAFFWLSLGGQMALLGQAIIFLPFRFALDKPFNLSNGLLGILAGFALFAAGLVATSLDYPSSAALPPTAIIFCWWIWYREKKENRKIPWLLLACALGLCIGAWLTLSASGNYCRLQLTTDVTVHEYMRQSWFTRIFSWLANIPGSLILQWVPVIFLIWGAYHLLHRRMNQFLKIVPQPVWLFILPAAFTYGAYLFTAWPPSRAFATISMQFAIMACIIFDTAKSKIPHRQILVMKCALALLCFISLTYEAYNFMALHNAILEREEIIASSKDGIAVLPPLPVKPDKYQVLNGNLQDIKEDPNFWVNRAMTLHYGVKEIRLQSNPAPIELYPQNQMADASLKTRIENGRIYSDLSSDVKAIAQVHYYYHGKPDILYKLPNFIEKPVYNWLKNLKPTDWAYKLLPLFLARADITLNPGENGGSGKSQLLTIADKDKLWLVKPGAGKYSFDLTPLQKRDISGEQEN